MTDKELRKLSRLELLELLLEAGKENEKLKEQIKGLKLENETAQNIERLSQITDQVENALRYTNNIADAFRTSSGGMKSSSAVNSGYRAGKKQFPPDVEIYKAMLNFFANNDDKLGVFPSELAEDVRDRIRSILERKK